MKRVPRLLLVAFALSLLVHFVVALILRPPSPTPESQAEVVSIEHRPATIAVTKAPTPPPRPKRTPSPRVVSSAPPRASKGPGTAAESSGSSPEATPVVARATPQPAATESSACTQRNAGAAVVGTPAPPDIATGARASGTSGTALVSVQLDALGQVASTSVAQSTGNSSLDLVAVAMARDTRYSPALRDCKPVASAYTFSVKFVAW
ncbi:MAG: TonB family protein [Candidatus Eremiobacteraeota bacterium]|nr:TonB family protein [Candidatus Eremiobacteraeota bacterium]